MPPHACAGRMVCGGVRTTAWQHLPGLACTRQAPPPVAASGTGRRDATEEASSAAPTLWCGQRRPTLLHATRSCTGFTSWPTRPRGGVLRAGGAAVPMPSSDSSNQPGSGATPAQQPHLYKSGRGSRRRRIRSILEAALLQWSRFSQLTGKFMPMVGLFFLLAFVNTILDSLKDTLVITAVGGGAQV